METATLYRRSAPDRKKALQSLVSDARKVDIRNDETFHAMIKLASVVLEVSDKQIGYALGVSRPTVNRWINGKNFPQFLMRKPIFDWIASEAGRKLRIVEDAEEVKGFVPSDPPALAARSE